MRQEFSWVSLIEEGATHRLEADAEVGELIASANTIYQQLDARAASAWRPVPKLHNLSGPQEESAGAVLGGPLLALLILAEEALPYGAPSRTELVERVAEDAQVAMDTGQFGRGWSVEDGATAWRMLAMFLNGMIETALAGSTGDLNMQEEFALQCSDALVTLLVVLMSEH